MRATIAIFIFFLLGGQAVGAEKAPNLAKYAGSDAGYLVFSVADAGENGTYEIRRLDAPGKATMFSISPSSFWTGKVDLKHAAFTKRFEKFPAPNQLETEWKNPGVFLKPFDGRGSIIVQKLPPGDYELYEIEFRSNNGVVEFIYPFRELSVPFSIRTGGASYIGEIGAISLFSRPLGYDLAVGLTLSLSNESERDIPLAVAKNQQIDAGKSEVFYPVHGLRAKAPPVDR